MVGTGVLIECLEDTRVSEVLVVGRTPCGVAHPKVREVIRSDFFDFTDLRPALAGYDACFFCLGVSAAGKTEAAYYHLTYDLTIAAAEAIAAVNSGLTFCYVSGEGTDSSEHGRVMWARVKGKTENQLLRMPFKAYMFRPGYIHPLKGVRSKTLMYRVLSPPFRVLFPLLKRVAARHVTTSVNVGRAMINVAATGYVKPVLENPDIDLVAAGQAAR